MLFSTSNYGWDKVHHSEIDLDNDERTSKNTSGRQTDRQGKILFVNLSNVVLFSPFVRR